MRVLIGYDEDGHKRWRDEGPSFARVEHYGGSKVEGLSGDGRSRNRAQRKPSRPRCLAVMKLAEEPCMRPKGHNREHRSGYDILNARDARNGANQ